ncbi:hypothetical protein [Brevibacterium jeotgali]|uniref:Uncharacterized protein n=1 Tax=Brevibacterium jeotgali TaxID=1262550 RepID=A0A2H1L702_9MICO|nr:hypothetical protein [Brevibacterium jeotgali]TWC02254.1 hypothetical protein FB108_0925 [Brevibacterium jeotgali]SMY12694.1 hypothetical protein BJEO58_02294 [Brevibacterium jeotgali]
MNIGTRLLLSAALAVGSTVGAAALGQNAVRDAHAEVGPSAPPSIPASAAPPTGADGGGGELGDGAGRSAADGAEADAESEAEREADTDTDASADVDADADAGADVDADDRVAGVRAELAAAAAAGEISWDAAERVSDELGGYIRGEVSIADVA